jgi:hypothetical protein
MAAGFWFGVALTTVVLGLLLRLPNRSATPPQAAAIDEDAPTPAET